MQKSISIEGMMCNHCAGAVEKALKEVPNVKNVTISLEKKEALVETTDDVSNESLQEAVTKAGYTVTAIS